ncbi:MAG: hypothetical protein J6O17_07655 [Eubacterium sp.]|nr:hypothetical protein [Eubacterium sp.]
MAATRVQTKGSVKASGIIFIILGIALAIIGCIILAVNASYMISGECKDLQSYIEEAKPYPTGEYVKLEVKSAFGPYAELKKTTNGIPTGTTQYYVLWLDDDNLISLGVSGKKNYEIMDKIVSETSSSSDGYSTTVFHAEGKLENITNNEQLKYYKEAVAGTEEMGFTIKTVEIDCTDSRSSLWGIFAILVGIGVLLLIVGVSYIKKASKMGSVPDASYSNAGYTPVDTTQPYTPVDTTQPYDQTGDQNYSDYNNQ